MKMKKIVAGVAAAAMAVTSMAAMSVSAIKVGDTVIDFEDGDCSFVYMNDLDGGTKATISVEDYNGSKQLKIDPEDGSLYSKIWFDLDSITARENTLNIGRIQYTVTVVPDSADAMVGWLGGQTGMAGGFDKTGANIQASQANPGWTGKDFDFTGGYNPGEAAVCKVDRKLMLKSEKYSADGTNPFFCFMLNVGDVASKTADAGYTTAYSIYIDDIKLLDVAGNPIPLGIAPVEETTVASEETTAAASEETTAAPEETTAAAEDADEDVAAPEEDEAEAEEPEETEAPETTAAEVVTTTAAADTTTAPVATGNVAVASIAAVMTVAGVAAIAAKKRK